MNEVTTTDADTTYVLKYSTVKFAGDPKATHIAECSCGWEFRMTGGGILETFAPIEAHADRHAKVEVQ